MDGTEQRAALGTAIDHAGESLAALSKMLGRNPAWLQQYIRRGTPRLLAEDDRRRLAAYLGIADSVLGGPAGPVLLPRLDVAASAGPGRIADGEAMAGREPIAEDTLRRLGTRAEDCSVVRVRGDSMEPLLADGDLIVVDTARRRPDTRGNGLWVVRTDGELRVKRIAATGGALRLVSDNPAYPQEVRPLGEVEVIGRVVRMMRDF